MGKITVYGIPENFSENQKTEKRQQQTEISKQKQNKENRNQKT